MKSITSRRLTVALIALLLGGGLSACNSPTAPRFPQPDKDADPKEPEEGARGRMASFSADAVGIWFV